MTDAPRHPLTLDGRDVSNLRGDPITGDRYFSKEFAQKEWDHMWTRIRQIAGKSSEEVDVPASVATVADLIVHLSAPTRRPYRLARPDSADRNDSAG